MSEQRDSIWTRLIALWPALQTVLIGAAGGALLTVVGWPASWLSGAVVAVAVFAVAGVCKPIPPTLRELAFVFLGVSMGAGMSPEALEGITEWPLSIILLIAIQPLVIGAVWFYLHRIAKWSSSTALFSAIPGALAYVIALADQSDADMPKVAITQSIRLFVLIVTLPALITALRVDDGSGIGAVTATADLAGAAVQLAAGAVGALLFAVLKIPAATLLGPFLVSAILHATNMVEGALPNYLMIPGLIIIGCVVGSRFVGATLRAIIAIFVPALNALLIALVLNWIAAVAAALLLGVPFAQTLLAYAPGGLDAMTVLAFALALDPAFVAAHHTSRFITMILVLPIFARRMLQRGPDD